MSDDGPEQSADDSHKSTSADKDPVLLKTRIRTEANFSRQQDTLIVWTEEDGTDMALSFQEQEGCEDLWKAIREIKMKLGGAGDTDIDGLHFNDGEDAPESGHAPIESIPDTGFSLPEPSMATIKEIEETMFATSKGMYGRGQLTKFILQENYIEKLLPMLEVCEDMECTEELYSLSHIVKMIDDREYPSAKSCYRQQVSLTQFKQLLPIPDPVIAKKISQTYRLQFLRDTALARMLDDATYAALNSMVFFNQVDIVGWFVGGPGGTGGEGEEYLGKVIGILNEEEVDIGEGVTVHRDDVVMFLLELSTVAKGMQISLRASYYRTMAKLGLFSVFDFTLVHEDLKVRLAAAAILASILDHDPSLVRSFCLAQVKQKQPQILVNLLITRFLCEPNPGLQSQLCELIRVIVDTEDSSTAGLTSTSTIVLSADSETDEFLNLFYENCINRLVAPLTALVDARSVAELDTIAAAQCAHICQLLCFFIRAHSYRSKYYMLGNSVTSKVVLLLGARETHVRLAALRVFRTCFGMKDEFYNRHLLKHDIFSSILQCFLDTGGKYNLLNSACLDVFEFIRKENVKTLVASVVQYKSMFADVTYVDTFKGLLLRHEQNQEVPIAGLADDGASPKILKKDPDGWSRIDNDEEAYFNEDDGGGYASNDEEPKDSMNADPVARPPALRAKATTTSASLTAKSSLSSGILRSNSSMKRSASPLGLVDYEDEDDGEDMLETIASATCHRGPLPQRKVSSDFADADVPLQNDGLRTSKGGANNIGSSAGVVGGARLSFSLGGGPVGTNVAAGKRRRTGSFSSDDNGDAGRGLTRKVHPVLSPSVASAYALPRHRRPFDILGEAFELRAELNSEYREKRKESVKKVIANMTIGKDVSGLFADVVKNMQTEDLELKKLVYLYLINYAKSQPELVILAVNTFLKDTDDINPLIRALAIRTLGCLRVEKVVDYLMEPLKKSLKDDDPYVRKTSALCVAKIFDLNPMICIDNGLISSLQEMLSDRNPMVRLFLRHVEVGRNVERNSSQVIANAVAALSEIHSQSPKDQIFVITPQVLTKLLAALNECTEWGQICILDSLATYKPQSSTREAADIVERVIARLQHANASVVLSAVKVLLIYMSYIDADLSKQVIKKMAPPLVTLLSSDPEIQFVALRNINLILQRHPQILAAEIRVFFTKYNDPLYVKLEKLEAIIKLVSLENIDQVLLELREYASEVDVEFVRRSVRAIGRCAVKLDGASERCVNLLLDLIKTKVSHVLQEAVVVIKDVFRKYPRKYEGVIPALCENLEALDEPEAKAALVWIIGEHAERIENAEELLEYFVDGFKEESAKVQLQLLTATVKLFLKRPGSAQELVQKILQLATQGIENPDIRDRAYIYWRLLSSNPQAAKAVVLAERPPIESDNSTVSESLLDELIFHIGTLASVYHKPAALMGVRADRVDLKLQASVDDEENTVDVQKVVEAVGGNIENLMDLDFGSPAPVPMPTAVTTNLPASASAANNIDDLLGIMDLGSSSSFHGTTAATSEAVETPRTQLLTAESSNGLDLAGWFSKRNGQMFLELAFTNKLSSGGASMTDFAIQFNVNIYGINASAPLSVPQLNPQQSAKVSLLLNRSGNRVAQQPPNAVQIAIKNSQGVYYCQLLVSDERVLV
ncbi:AP-1 complex subunit beta-1 [Entophlyctis luteolus]|nr:AP-1 complex subunit beta-1 [Entophlyctis luteolus]